jgi:hypothetical protein
MGVLVLRRECAHPRVCLRRPEGPPCGARKFGSACKRGPLRVLLPRIGHQFANPLPGFHTKILLLSVLGTAVALLGVIGITLAYAALDDLFPENASFDQHDLENLLRLQWQLRRLLLLDGAIIGAAVLSSGALRHALLVYYNTYEPKAGFSFPQEYVLPYGAFFRAARARLRTRLRTTTQRRPPLPRQRRTAPIPPRRKLEQRLRQTPKLEELLQLQLTTSASFRTGVAILPPLQRRTQPPPRRRQVTIRGSRGQRSLELDAGVRAVHPRLACLVPSVWVNWAAVYAGRAGRL